jgi:hypothetical protein
METTIFCDLASVLVSFLGLELEAHNEHSSAERPSICADTVGTASAPIDQRCLALRTVVQGIWGVPSSALKVRFDEFCCYLYQNSVLLLRAL